MLKIVKEIIAKANDRDYFFSVISHIYPSLDWRYKLIERAYDDAEEAFREKKRDGGSLYFEHIRATTLILMLYLRVVDYKMIIAAILHDIVEDINGWSIVRVQDRYGEDIACLVQYMTKPSAIAGESPEDIYHSRFFQAPRNFFLIKLSDRLHNVLTLNSCTLDKRVRKIQETKNCYMPFAETNQILYHELVAAMDEVNLLEELNGSPALYH